MRKLIAIIAIAAVSTLGLAACGTKTKTVVVHDKPKVTTPAPTAPPVTLPPVTTPPPTPAPTPPPVTTPAADGSAGHWYPADKAQFEQGFWSSYTGDHTLGTCLVTYVEDHYSEQQVTSSSFDMTAAARAGMTSCTSQSA